MRIWTYRFFIAFTLSVILIGQHVAFGLSGAASQNDTAGGRYESSVFVGGCSGVLVRPDIVMTAGHCVGQHGFPNGPYEDFGIRRTGIWYPTLDARGDAILFGRDRRSPTYTATATHYNIMDGIDLAFFALSDPVPSIVAQPTPLLTVDPGIDWSQQFFRQSGWGPRTTGGNTPVLRGGGNAAGGFFTDPSSPHMMSIESGAMIQPGDSGGPLYWTDTDGKEWVIGAARTTPNLYTTTFVDTLHSDINPDQYNLSAYTSQVVGAPARDQIAAQEIRPAGREIHEWYSPSRGDNFLTSQIGWTGSPGETRVPDYTHSQLSGYVFSPDRPQPDGTIPLYSWWSPGREDNFTTTQDGWVISYDPDPNVPNRGATRAPDYVNAKLFGYILPPDEPQRPETVPLYRWYSPARGDNFTTTQWPGTPGDTRLPDYSFSRLEGYLLTDDPGIFLVRGDFNYDTQVAVEDVDLLAAEIQLGTHRPDYDLTRDGLVDFDDLQLWVTTRARTYFGDADLDGKFDSTDLVKVLQSGEFEDTVDRNSTWADGDFNGNGDFETGDLILAFSDGGYEKGPRNAIVSVPEPNGFQIVATFCLLLLIVDRHGFRQRHSPRLRQTACGLVI